MSTNGSSAGGLQVLDRKVYSAGATIFREGETGSRAYIIQRGRVDIWKRINGQKSVVGSVGVGGIFGEMALIDNEPRMASATAADHCVCIVITEIMFRKKLRTVDPFLAGVLRILVENIRSIQVAKKETEVLDAMFNDSAGGGAPEIAPEIASENIEDLGEPVFEIG